MPYLNSPKAIEACKVKIIYYTQAKAEQAAHKLAEDGLAEWAGAYPCRGVKGQRRHWHVTTKQPKNENDSQ